jgi:hypothetical protein
MEIQTQVRTCRYCHHPQDINNFRMRKGNKLSGDKRWRSWKCKKCTHNDSIECKIRLYGKDPTQKTRGQRYQAKVKEARRVDIRGPIVAREILHNSRKTDKNNKLENNLTILFIEKTIEKPCCYCGENNIKMTLDRINNSMGHSEMNVVAACIRCNNIRRDMPYNTWLFLVPKIKEAKELGLFDDWNAYWQKGKKPIESPPVGDCSGVNTKFK